MQCILFQCLEGTQVVEGLKGSDGLVRREPGEMVEVAASGRWWRSLPPFTGSYSVGGR